jgi:hypothetical protein
MKQSRPQGALGRDCFASLAMTPVSRNKGLIQGRVSRAGRWSSRKKRGGAVVPPLSPAY